MEQSLRRYDIDWLRVIAIALLLIYHASIVFQPWGVFIGFIQSSESLEWLWIPMSMLNIWRIPLLFFVSGMGVSFAMRKRTWKELIKERSQRILLPLLFGMLIIVPVHVAIWQNYYSQDFSYIFSRGHLWFLANIFAYVLILLPLFYFLKNKKDSPLHVFIQKYFSQPYSFLIVSLLFVVEVFLVKPESFELYAMTWHGFYLGMISFLSGFIMVYSGQRFWDMLLKWKWFYFCFAAILYSVRVAVFDLNAPLYLKSIESVAWIFTIFGFGYSNLNHKSTMLTYLSKAAYPVYILHMIFLYLGASIILDIPINAEIKFVLVTIFSFLGSLIVYEAVLRRFRWAGLFFGVSPKMKLISLKSKKDKDRSLVA